MPTPSGNDALQSVLMKGNHESTILPQRRSLKRVPRGEGAENMSRTGISWTGPDGMFRVFDKLMSSSGVRTDDVSPPSGGRMNPPVRSPFVDIHGRPDWITYGGTRDAQTLEISVKCAGHGQFDSALL